MITCAGALEVIDWDAVGVSFACEQAVLSRATDDDSLIAQMDCVVGYDDPVDLFCWVKTMKLYTNNPSKRFLYLLIYRKVSNIRRTLVGNKIVDHSDVVGASPVGAAPTTSSFST